MRIERLREEYEIALKWRSFPLHPEIPQEGISLEQLFIDHPADLKGMMHRLSMTAADLGLPFRPSDMIYNSRFAQELGKWAESKNKGEEFHIAAFRAYFVDGKNISEIEVLQDLGLAVGLPGDEAAEVIAAGSFRSAVDSDWSLSRKNGIMAVPTLVLNGDKLVGAQPYGAMEKLMESNGVPRRRES